MPICVINFPDYQIWATGKIYNGLFLSNKTGGFYYVVDHYTGLPLAKFRKRANAKTLIDELIDQIAWQWLQYENDKPVLTAHERDTIRTIIYILEEQE
jgi:hypothetical protein